jgi:hypothetical protein
MNKTEGAGTVHSKSQGGDDILAFRRNFFLRLALGFCSLNNQILPKSSGWNNKNSYSDDKMDRVPHPHNMDSLERPQFEPDTCMRLRADNMPFLGNNHRDIRYIQRAVRHNIHRAAHGLASDVQQMPNWLRSRLSQLSPSLILCVSWLHPFLLKDFFVFS